MQLKVWCETDLLACWLAPVLQASMASLSHHALGHEWDAPLLDPQGMAETRLQPSQTRPL